MTTVIAFHGDFASPEMLCRDMGNPSWVNVFWEGFDACEVFVKYKDAPVVLVGYSHGGILCGELTNWLTNIKGIVAYESPLHSIPLSLETPVLIIRNSYDRPRWRCKALDEAEMLWRLGGRKVDKLISEQYKRHVSTHPLGHAWDTDLNDQIMEWLGRNAA